MLPYKIYTRKKIFNYYTGLSFFIFVWISRLDEDEVRLMRHETIHFWQQVEMFFIFHWMFYAFFYLLARARGQCHYIAYRYNPFEIEAFNNDPDEEYLKKRRPFAWVTYLKKYHDTISKDMRAAVPKDKLINWKSIGIPKNSNQSR
jgi:hypothetical protein